MCEPFDEANWYLAFPDFWYNGSRYMVETNSHELDVFARVFRLNYENGKWEKLFECSLVDLLPEFIVFHAYDELEKAEQTIENYKR